MAQAAGAEAAQVDRHGQRHELLAGADVGGGALAPDVLLARLQRQDEGAAAGGVDRLPDDAARHLAHVLHPRREKADVGAAEAQRQPERLALADDDVGAELPRRPQEAEAHRVGADDEQGAGGVRRRGRLLARKRDAAVVVWRLDNEGGVLLGQSRRRRHHVQADAERLRVGLDDGQVARVQRVGDREPVSPRQAAGHEAGLGQGAGAVVEPRVRRLAAVEGGDQRLKLEGGLQRPLRRLRLIRRIGGKELAAADDLVDDGRDEALVSAAAAEGRLAAAGRIRRCERLHLRHELDLGEGWRQAVQVGAAGSGRDVGEEGVGARHADRREHHRPVLRRHRHVGAAQVRGPPPARSGWYKPPASGASRARSGR